MAKAAAAAKPQTTAVANWDEELARQAEVSAAMEAKSGGGQFFSVRAGQLSFDGNVFPNNEMAVVILDTILEHVFFEGKYDADNPTPPTCFAFTREEDEDAVPHDEVFKKEQAVNPTCAGCPNGEWASADTGRGKACRWTRRLALLPAGGLVKGNFEPDEDPISYEKGVVGFLRLPVTSVKLYSGMVKQVASVLKRPPHGVFTRIWLTPDPKTQFKVNFEMLGPVPNALLPAIMARHKAQQAPGMTDFPYNLDAEPAAPPPPKRGGRRKY